jgi:hypothetical protein
MVDCLHILIHFCFPLEFIPGNTSLFAEPVAGTATGPRLRVGDGSPDPRPYLAGWPARFGSSAAFSRSALFAKAGSNPG